MKSSSKKTYRAKPLLGTIVEVSIVDASYDLACQYYQRVFDRISEIQNLLSFHDSNSELSRVNSAIAGSELKVSQHLTYILSFCHQLMIDSSASFNPYIAPILQRAGILPKTSQLKREILGISKPIEILSSTRIGISSEVCLDLGGIAKGYAVDYAGKIFEEIPELNATINAGGDLKVFGPRNHQISIRDPRNHRVLAEQISLSNQAIATSASYYIPSELASSAIVDGCSGKILNTTSSISIIADSCMIADALTKPAYTLSETRMTPILEKYQASMIQFDISKIDEGVASA